MLQLAAAVWVLMTDCSYQACRLADGDDIVIPIVPDPEDEDNTGPGTAKPGELNAHHVPRVR